MAYKNIYFHKINLTEKIIDTKNNKVIIKNKSDNELKTLVESLITKDKLQNNCLLLEEGKNQETLEIISDDEKYIFARIGKIKDFKSVHFRNIVTLKSSPITKAANQEIEIFTYILIDKNNFVISFLRESSAPSIRKISGLKRYFTNQNLDLEISAITIKDVLRVLKNKDTVSSISYLISVPADKIIDIDEIGLSEKDFEYYSNIKTTTIEVKMVAGRNKNIFKNFKDNIDSFVSGLKKLKTGEMKGITFKAKNKNEYTQSYNIFDDIFCKKVQFKFNAEVSNLTEEIKNKLISTYETNKTELMDYIKK